MSANSAMAIENEVFKVILTIKEVWQSGATYSKTSRGIMILELLVICFLEWLGNAKMILGYRMAGNHFFLLFIIECSACIVLGLGIVLHWEKE